MRLARQLQCAPAGKCKSPAPDESRGSTPIGLLYWATAPRRSAVVTARRHFQERALAWVESHGLLS